MPRRTPCVVALVVAAASAASYARAQESDVAGAQALFDEARRLEDAGKISEACPKFLASYKLDPKSGTMVNLADCYEKDGKTASAWARYLEAATLAERAGFAERAQYAREHAAQLEPTLARMAIEVAPDARAPGLRVARDGVLLDDAALGSAIPVDPGMHVIEASATGKRAWSTRVEVAKGARVEVPIPRLMDDVQSTTTTAPPPRSANGRPNSTTTTTATTVSTSGWGAQKVVAVVVGGVGVVALGAGGLFALDAKSTWSDAQSAHCQGTVCDAQGVAANDDARSAATRATIATLSGALLVGTGVVLWLTAPKAGEGEPRVGIAPTLGGAALRGTF